MLALHPLEAVRLVDEAFNRGDPEGLLANCESTTLRRHPNGGWRMADGNRELLGRGVPGLKRRLQ